MVTMNPYGNGDGSGYGHGNGCGDGYGGMHMVAEVSAS